MCAALDDPRKYYPKGRGLMNWNQDILNNDELSATDKFVYHLLADLGDGAETRRQVAEIAGISDRHFRKVAAKLRSLRTETVIQDRNGHTGPKSSNACANIASFTKVKDSTLTKVKVGTATGRIDPPAVAALEPFSDDEIITDNDIASTPDDDPPVELGDEANEAIEEMASLWADLDPDALCLDPTPWFRKLIFEYGAEIPVAAIRQFYLDDRQLDDLENPVAFKGYFRRICDRLKTEGIPAPPVNGGVTSAANNPYKSKNDPQYDKWSDPAQFAGLPASSITAECAE